MKKIILLFLAFNFINLNSKDPNFWEPGQKQSCKVSTDCKKFCSDWRNKTSNKDFPECDPICDQGNCLCCYLD